MSDTISPADPAVILAGIRQFGLAPDGSDLRDLAAAFARRDAEIARLRKALRRIAENDGPDEDLYVREMRDIAYATLET